ncbi:EAP30/Vps36 family-domain-containing protein [Phakopsora pachyrhizi]|nr:EAP30/Vps36 family-domain-containing protein [Phakopsora pachyrhizi]
MRRTVGISSLERSSITNASYNNLSDSLSAANLVNLQRQLFTFQSSLKSFATKHGNKIKSDPDFRKAFSEMCNELGVDPLSNSRRGFWDWIGLGDWTFELAIQVVDVCLWTRDRNGGLHEMEDVLKAVRELRSMPKISDQADASQHQPTTINSSKISLNDQMKKKIGLINKPISELLQSTITEADITRAIKCLEPLGCGYCIINIGNKKFLRSVPVELDNDSLLLFDSILSSESTIGYTTHKILRDHTGWNSDRVRHCIEKAMMTESTIWIDSQAFDEGDGSDRFYAPSLFVFEESIEQH